MEKNPNEEIHAKENNAIAGLLVGILISIPFWIVIISGIAILLKKC